MHVQWQRTLQVTCQWQQTLHGQTMPRKDSAPTTAKGTAAAGKGVAQLLPISMPEDSVNAEHFIVVQKAMEKIEACPVMDGIRNAPPIPRGVVDPITGKTGYKDVFTQTKFKSDMLAAGISEQAGNFFYQNSFLVPLAGVPLNRQSMDILRDRNFKEPIAFPDKLLVAIPGAGYDAGAHLGAWQHITPEELIHAYILAVARDTDDHAKMKTWRYHLLTVTFSFVIAAGDDVHWKQARVREDTEAAFRVVYRSALQRVYEINMVLARRAGPSGKAGSGTKALSHAQLAELYKQHLQQLNSQEKISTTYITDAVRLYKSLLCDVSVLGHRGGDGRFGAYVRNLGHLRECRAEPSRCINTNIFMLFSGA